MARSINSAITNITDLTAFADIEKFLAEQATIRVGFRWDAPVNRFNKFISKRSEVVGVDGPRRRETDLATLEGRRWRAVGRIGPPRRVEASVRPFTAALQSLHIFEDGLIRKIGPNSKDLTRDKAPCFLAHPELHLRMWTYPFVKNRKEVEALLDNGKRQEAIEKAKVFHEQQYTARNLYRLLENIALAVNEIAAHLRS